MGEVRPPHEINKAALRGRNPTGPLGWMQIYGDPAGSTRTSNGSCDAVGASGHRLGGVTIDACSILSGSTGPEMGEWQ
jgi:hypothetical protein